MVVGIYGVHSQSGKSYFADLLDRGYEVIGYSRPEGKGRLVLDTISRAGGIYLERPLNSNHEVSKLIPLGNSTLTSDLNYMLSKVDVVIFALPSIYQESSIQSMCDAGIWKRRIPIVLSPSRTVASPYLWKIVGERYPITCFSTCPYSCKAPSLGTSYIKRRKRTWMISLEGDFNPVQETLIRDLFPQAAISKIPALTSLNNIGAIFHCATYLLNYDKILAYKKENSAFSFYMDGIAKCPDIAKTLEEIDQVRLQIANALGLNVFGLRSNPREDVWRKLTNGLRALEAEHENDIDILRTIRKQFMEYLNNCVVSAQHWLDITYGVTRIPGESLAESIARTPTYQKNSVPQLRYMTEDIPTGLVPMEALANLLGIDSTPISVIIDRYENQFNTEARKEGRNLKIFSKDYIINYLLGKYE